MYRKFQKKIVHFSYLIKIVVENKFIAIQCTLNEHWEYSISIVVGVCINLFQAQCTQPTYFSHSKQPDSILNPIQCSSLTLKIKFKNESNEKTYTYHIKFTQRTFK